MDLIIITGLSGAGKTAALTVFEDLGYLTISNLPVSLMSQWLTHTEALKTSKGLALVSALPNAVAVKELLDLLAVFKQDSKFSFRLLFLEADDKQLVSRYKETRRPHPLAPSKRLLDGIALERERLAPLKECSQAVIDTSGLSLQDLRYQLQDFCTSKLARQAFRIELISFGFKYGLPLDADLVFDVRFLPNPYYQSDLRSKTGLDSSVYGYVMAHQKAQTFYQHLLSLLKTTLPHYQAEGKAFLTLAIGCTGGQHRSVAFVQRLAKDLTEDWSVRCSHRDKASNQEQVNQ